MATRLFPKLHKAHNLQSAAKGSRLPLLLSNVSVVCGGLAAANRCLEQRVKRGEERNMFAHFRVSARKLALCGLVARCEREGLSLSQHV